MKDITRRSVARLLILGLIALAACTPQATPPPTSAPTDIPAPTDTPAPQVGALLPTRVPPTEGPSPTLLPTDTGTPTDTPVPSDTPTPSDTPVPSDTPTATPTPTTTDTPSATATATPTPTQTPTPTATASLTQTHTPPPSASLRVVLRWRTTGNVDLGVRDPNNEFLSVLQPQAQASGGAFLGDANFPCASAVPNPQEEIVWGGGPPPGTYTVFASYQGECGNVGPVEIEVVVQLGAVELLRQTASLEFGLPPFSFAFDFDPASGTAVVVTGPPTPAGPVPIAYGDSVTDTISSERYEVLYTFSGIAGDVITVDMQRRTGNLDPYLILRDASGAQLAANDDAATGERNARIEATLPQSGTYTLVATRFQFANGASTGGFILTLQRTATGGGPTPGPGAGIVDGGSLAYGASVTGEITAAQYAYRYTFSGAQGDVIVVNLMQIGGNLDTFLALLDASGNEIATDDDGGDGLNSRLIMALPTSGTYTLLATRFGQQTGTSSGTFLLTLEQGEESALVPSATPAATSTLPPAGVSFVAYGSIETGSLSDAFYERQYRFFGSQGDTVTISMDQTSGNLDPLLRLFDPAGDEIASDDDSGEGLNARLVATLPGPGLYTLVATRFGGENGVTSGDYRLTLTLGGEPRAGVAGAFQPSAVVFLPYGASESGFITQGEDGYAYLFYGAAGDEIAVTMTRVSGNLDSRLVLVRAATNEELAANAGSDGSPSAAMTHVLPDSGLYAILATTQVRGGSGGDFLLTLNLAARGGEPGANFRQVLAAYDAGNSGAVSDEGRVFATVFPGDDVRNHDYRGFLSFALPDGLTQEALLGAALILGDCTANNDPFADLGALLVGALVYERLDAQDFDPPDRVTPLGEVTTCPAEPVDATATVRAALGQDAPQVQFRLSFPPSDGDGAIDDATFADPQLVIEARAP